MSRRRCSRPCLETRHDAGDSQEDAAARRARRPGREDGGVRGLRDAGHVSRRHQRRAPGGARGRGHLRRLAHGRVRGLGARPQRLRAARHLQRRRRAEAGPGAVLGDPHRARHVRGRLPRVPLRRPPDAGRQRRQPRRGLGAHRGTKGGANVRLKDVSDDVALLAVQGPKAEALLAPLTSLGVAMIPYYHFTEGKVAGAEVFVSRTGYTGEDGFEIYCRAADAEQLWHALAGPGRAEPCGLGARDTLRLEAGLPLYGNDIDDTVTPYEAGLSFIVKLDKGAPFTGEAALKKQKLEGVTRRLVGFTVLEPKVVGRHGMDVYVDGKKVDIVRSGTVTPTVNEAIGTTYVPKAQAQPGMKLEIDVRGKRVPAEVVKLPFVPHRTKR